MAPKSSTKTKAQELQRIRDNQQRSRDRKRAYIIQLEDEVRRLNERWSRSEAKGQEAKSSPNVATQNDARKELLKALGIDEAAQEQFVRAFEKRAAASAVATDLRAAEVDSTASRTANATDARGVASSTWEANPSIGRHQGTVDNIQSFRSETFQDTSMSRTVASGPGMLSSDKGSVGQNATMAFDGQQGIAEGQLTASPNAAPESMGSRLQAQHHRPTEQPAVFTPCLWNATGSSSCSESKTGCSVAFSMLLANNSRGYTFADLDARLQAAYRQDDSVAEGCSVLNKVLYELLGEIS